MVLVLAVVSGAQGMLVIWNSINWGKLAKFLVPALFGIPVGWKLLSWFEPFFLKMLIACFLIAYGGLFLFRKNLPQLQTQRPLVDGFIGFSGGVLGSFAGLSGALPTMWAALHPWAKDQQRALLQPFNIFVLGLSALLLAYNGAYTKAVLINLGIAVPVSLASAYLGILIYGRLKDAQFRRLMIGLMFLSGLTLILREILV